MYMVEAWLHVRDVCSDLRVGKSVVGSIPSISREDFSCKSKMLFTIKHILGPSPFHLLSTTNNKNIIEFAWLFLAAAKRYGHAFKDQTNNPENSFKTSHSRRVFPESIFFCLATLFLPSVTLIVLHTAKKEV